MAKTVCSGVWGLHKQNCVPSRGLLIASADGVVLRRLPSFFRSLAADPARPWGVVRAVALKTGRDEKPRLSWVTTEARGARRSSLT